MVILLMICRGSSYTLSTGTGTLRANERIERVDQFTLFAPEKFELLRKIAQQTHSQKQQQQQQP